MAVALGLQPAAALLNDANVHLINFYRWVKRGLTVDVPLCNDRAAYLDARRQFNALVSSGGGRSQRAAVLLFYYLNRTGYNGLCRFNQKGAFNVPFTSYNRIAYATDFLKYRRALRHWSLSSVDLAGGVSPRRLRLCQSSLRCRVHPILAGRVFVGRSGSDGDPPGCPPPDPWCWSTRPPNESSTCHATSDSRST